MGVSVGRGWFVGSWVGGEEGEAWEMGEVWGVQAVRGRRMVKRRSRKRRVGIMLKFYPQLRVCAVFDLQRRNIPPVAQVNVQPHHKRKASAQNATDTFCVPKIQVQDSFIRKI